MEAQVRVVERLAVLEVESSQTWKLNPSPLKSRAVTFRNVQRLHHTP